MTRVDTRRALVVGINDYPSAPLRGCINDAKAIRELLDKHESGDPNFDCQSLLSSDKVVTTAELKRKVKDLLGGEAAFALFFYSGHGYLDSVGGYLVTQDACADHEGVTMQWLVDMANDSKIPEILIILDCCFAGAAGDRSNGKEGQSELRKGVTILAASAGFQKAAERKGQGIFTSILVNGLKGQAADLLGHVTAASLYNHADSLLTAWQQRPIFKCHVSKMTPVRYCHSKVPKVILRKLTELFPTPTANFRLTPEYEESSDTTVIDKVEQFKNLGKLERVGIITCLEESSLYWEAINSGGCKLTPYGEFVWEMTKRNRI